MTQTAAPALTITHRTVTPAATPLYPALGRGGESTHTVYRDRELGVTVVHTTHHRGGCLYAGTVTAFRTAGTGERISFSSTQGPMDADSPYLASIAARVA